MADPTPPKPPELACDFDVRAPLLVHNTLPLSGWAIAAEGIESVKLRVDGREYAASYGLPAKEDIGHAEWPDASHPRFALELEVSDWPRGEHRFEIVATDRAGGTTAVECTADVQPYVAPPGDQGALVETATGGGTAMWCEAPALDGGEVRGPLEVTGWAVGAGGIEKVIVTVDGRLRIEALHGLMRPDLRDSFGEELASACGYTLRLDPREVPLGWHDLTVVAVAGDGTGVGVSGSVHCLPSDADLADLVGEGTASEGDAGEVQTMPGPDDNGKRGPEHHLRYGWAARLTVGKRVLDAGCGVGWGTAQLAEEAEQAVGVDASPAAIAEARRLHDGRSAFAEGDLTQLPFDADSFDVAVCFEAIEQVADVEAALDELRRVLRPGGLLLVSVANREVYPPGNPLHLSALSSGEAEALVRARFTNVNVYREQSYTASLLGNEAALAEDDPRKELGARTAKTTGGAPGSELYAVFAASDGSLPADPASIVLGAPAGHDEQRRQAEYWQDRAIHAEIDAAASRTEFHYARSVQSETLARANAERAAYEERIREMDSRNAELEGQLLDERSRAESATENLAAVESSLSWRLTKPLRSLKRLFRGGG